MKICQILYSGLGGHGSVAFSIIDGEVDRNDHSMIFYGIEPLIEEYKEKCVERSVRFVGITKSPGVDVSSIVRIYQALRNLNPGTVIVHSETAVLPAWLYCCFFDKKLIIVEHTPINVKTRKHWVISTMNHWFSNKTVLLTNSYYKVYKRNVLFTRSSKIFIIPNGINTEFYHLDQGFATYGLSLGMLSRLSKPKNHKTLIKAMQILNDRGISFKLSIAGDGEMKDSLQKYVKHHGLRERINFLGLLEGKEVINFFQDLTVYVHSSISETMSTSIMQALSCGVPVIAADIEGVKDLIEDNQTGLLFDPENPEDLADKITFLYENQPLQQSLSKNARAFAVSNLSQEYMSLKYQKLCM